jgi:hypothetical protein
MMVFVRVWGLFSIVSVLGLVGLSLAFPVDACKPGAGGEYPGGFKKPIIALELAGSGGALTEILESPDCRSQQARALVVDNFGNIPLYGIWLAGLCFLLIRARSSGIRIVGIASLVSVSIAVVCDYIEDHFMSVAIRHQEDFTDQMAANIRHPSMVKWLTIFLTVALLSTLFIRIGMAGSIMAWCIAACFLISFVVDVVALVYSLPLIEWVWAPLFPAIALISYLFLREPELVCASL